MYPVGVTRVNHHLSRGWRRHPGRRLLRAGGIRRARVEFARRAWKTKSPPAP